MPIGEIGDADAQGLYLVVAELALDAEEILIVQDIAEATLQDPAGSAHVLGIAKRPPVDAAQGTQCDAALIIVQAAEGPCGQQNLTAEVALIDGVIFRIKRTLIHDIVNEHQVDPAGVGALFEYTRPEHFFGAHDFLAQISALLIFYVKSFKQLGVSIKCFVEIRHFIGIKERDVFSVAESAPEKCR